MLCRTTKYVHIVHSFIHSFHTNTKCFIFFCLSLLISLALSLSLCIFNIFVYMLLLQYILLIICERKTIFTFGMSLLICLLFYELNSRCHFPNQIGQYCAETNKDVTQFFFINEEYNYKFIIVGKKKFFLRERSQTRKQ